MCWKITFGAVLVEQVRQLVLERVSKEHEAVERGMSESERK